MQLTFLGTGSAMPTGERAQSGYLVQTSDANILVDCGSGVLHALQRTAVGYEGIDAVLLTHHHLDHISDLDVLLKARWLAGETELTIAGPPGTADLVADLLTVHEYMAGRMDLDLRDIGGTFTLAGLSIDSYETTHSMQCFAYRVRPAADGPALVLGGDSEAVPGLIAFADPAGVLVHDCSFPDDVDVSNHPTPSQLGEVLGSVAPDIGRVYLTHFYPHAGGRIEEMAATVDDAFEGTVKPATDGLAVRIASE
jgi:ribonuclease BN (tRNA processing enzyme)